MATVGHDAVQVRLGCGRESLVAAVAVIVVVMVAQHFLLPLQTVLVRVILYRVLLLLLLVTVQVGVATLLLVVTIGGRVLVGIAPDGALVHGHHFAFLQTGLVWQRWAAS